MRHLEPWPAYIEPVEWRAAETSCMTFRLDSPSWLRPCRKHRRFFDRPSRPGHLAHVPPHTLDARTRARARLRRVPTEKPVPTLRNHRHAPVSQQAFVEHEPPLAFHRVPERISAVPSRGLFDGTICSSISSQPRGSIDESDSTLRRPSEAKSPSYHRWGSLMERDFPSQQEHLHAAALGNSAPPRMHVLHSGLGLGLRLCRTLSCAHGSKWQYSYR